MLVFIVLLLSDIFSINIVFNDVIVNMYYDYDYLMGEFMCSVFGIYFFMWNVVINGYFFRIWLVIQIKGGLFIIVLDIVGEENKGDEYDSSIGVFIYFFNFGDIVRIVKIMGKVEGGYLFFFGWMFF